MANFFVDKDAFINDPLIIEGEEANHIIKVLRMKEGETLTVFDGEGSCADGVIEKIEQYWKDDEVMFVLSPAT